MGMYYPRPSVRSAPAYGGLPRISLVFVVLQSAWERKVPREISFTPKLACHYAST